MARHEQVASVRLEQGVNGSVTPAEALVRTFNEVRDELLSALLFVLGNRDDAQDAAQEAFLKCWNAREQLGEILNLRAWIFRVCFNTAKDMQRSAWHRRAKPMRAEEFTMAGKEPAPGDVLDRKENLERLRLAIRGLRDEEQEVFLLRQNGDLTYEEIAHMRRCPVGTIKTQMRSALEKLRRILA
jgi:RNA polymerase sigma factor (sigma-70 family)